MVKGELVVSCNHCCLSMYNLRLLLLAVDALTEHQAAALQGAVISAVLHTAVAESSACHASVYLL
jgi:hypothetical protein